MRDSEFMGIPVHGEIHGGWEKPAQRPRSELEPLFRAVLDDEAIVEFGWRQFANEFDVGDHYTYQTEDFWVRTDQDGPERTPDELRFERWADPHPTLGKLGDGREGTAHQGAYPERAARLMALEEALTSAAFHDVLDELFGFRTLVTVRRDRIQVTDWDDED